MHLKTAKKGFLKVVLVSLGNASLRDFIDSNLGSHGIQRTLIRILLIGCSHDERPANCTLLIVNIILVNAFNTGGARNAFAGNIPSSQNLKKRSTNSKLQLQR